MFNIFKSKSEPKKESSWVAPKKKPTSNKKYTSWNGKRKSDVTKSAFGRKW